MKFRWGILFLLKEVWKLAATIISCFLIEKVIFESLLHAAYELRDPIAVIL